MKFILSLRMVASVPYSISLRSWRMDVSLSASICFMVLACLYMGEMVPGYIYVYF
jgi:hypothetical protein